MQHSAVKGTKGYFLKVFISYPEQNSNIKYLSVGIHNHLYLDILSEQLCISNVKIIGWSQS